MANLERNLEQDRLPQGTAIKDVLLNAQSFDEAVEFLSTVKMTSPGHFTIGGTGSEEGMILSRDADRVDRLVRLEENNNQQWFLAMTNVDVW